MSKVSSFYGPADIITSDEYLHDIPGFLRVHKDGRCERFLGTNKLPTGIDPLTGVESKDIVMSPESGVFARLYIPKTATRDRNLPVLIYIHGGGFVFESTTSVTYHSTVNHLTAVLEVITVSIEYRLGPEYPVLTEYDDCWEAIKWIASHHTGCGPDPWLNEYGDFRKVFLGGDSAGANISHNMALRFGSNPIVGIKFEAILMLNPFFGGKDPIGSELGKHKKLKAFTDQFWNLANRSESGLDDPLFNPEKDPNLSAFGCSNILVVVAEKDSFRDRGLRYKELMETSGWPGKLELIETKDEDHAFFLFDHVSRNSCTFYNNICTYVNRYSRV